MWHRKQGSNGTEALVSHDKMVGETVTQLAEHNSMITKQKIEIQGTVFQKYSWIDIVIPLSE